MPNEARERAYATLEAFSHQPTDRSLLDEINQLIESESTRRFGSEYLEELLASDSLSDRKRQAALLLGHLTNHTGTYRAAFGELDLTPSLEHPAVLQGFAPPRTATGVATPLCAQLLLLEDRAGHKALIVSADLFGFGEVMVRHVRDVAREWGIPPEAVVLNASHTHYAPGTVENVSDFIGAVDSGYASRVASAIGRSIEQLIAGLEPCFTYSEKVEVSIGANRCTVVDGKVAFRINEDGEYRATTPVILFHFLRSASSVLVVNHGCHPTGLGRLDDITSGYPGYFRRYLLENEIADGVMMLQGAAGTAKQTADEGEDVRFADSVDDVIRNAAHLAEAVVSLLADPMAPVSGDFFAKRRIVRLPYERIPSTEEYTSIAADTSRREFVRAWAACLAQQDEKDRSAQLVTEMQLFAFGTDLCLLTLAGEPSAGLAHDIISRTEFPDDGLILGYTNGLHAYYLSEDLLALPGYESSTSVVVYNMTYNLATSSANELISAAGELVDAWRESGIANGYGRYELNTSPGEAFFCLSTGRCGTQTLKHILDTASNARVYHHPRPYLIDETLAAYHDQLDSNEVFWRARGDVIRDAWKDRLVFGELDHNMTPFTPAIAESIPASRFIVLARNPWDFVRSGMRRGYYRGHPWDSGRLRPENRHSDFRTWTSMNPFEKTCWLWNETYKRIFTYLEDIPAERYRVVQFEHLVASSDESRALFEWLGLDGFDEDRVSDILGQELNKQTAGSFPPIEEWSDDQHATLERYCGIMADHFGYSRPRQSERSDSQAVIKTPLPAAGAAYSPRPRLLFLEQDGISTGGHLVHVEEYLRTRYATTYLKTTDLQEAATAVESHDLIWLEWASPLTAAATEHLPALRRKPVICRLHGFEVFTDLPKKIDWSVVDNLIFVAEHKRDRFKQIAPNAGVKTSVIRNGVVAERFSIAPQKENTKRLLLLGHLNYRKGLDLLMQFFHQLRQEDPAFELVIRGDWQDQRYRMAIMTMVEELDLRESVTFEEKWIDDLNAWLADKSHILSFSLEESFHYAIGNGMAAGMKPVIHAWNESRSIWPEEFIFSNLDQFLELMLDETFEPNRYRSLLFENGLDDARQLSEIDAVITSLLNEEQYSAGIDVSGDGAIAEVTHVGGDGASVTAAPGHGDSATVAAWHSRSIGNAFARRLQSRR